VKKQNVIPALIIPPTTKLKKTTTSTTTTVASVSSRHKLQPPLSASLTTTLHRPLRHSSSGSGSSGSSHLTKTQPKYVLNFVSCCFSLNKGRWLKK